MTTMTLEYPVWFRDIKPSTVVTMSLPNHGPNQWDAVIYQQQRVVRRLTANEYAHIVEATKNTPGYIHEPPPLASTQPPQNRQSMHFGTLLSGSAKIFFINKLIPQPNTTVVEVKVIDKQPSESSSSSSSSPVTQSVWKSNRVWTESEQGTRHEINGGELIEVVLPGSASDEWEVNEDESGFALERRLSGKPGFVRHIFFAVGEGKPTLTIKHRGAIARDYLFPVSYRPRPLQPTC